MLLVAGTDEQHVSIRIGREFANNFVALLSGPLVPLHTKSGASMRFVYDHKFWTGSNELVATIFGFDIVKRDHDEWEDIEDRPIATVFVEPTGGTCQN